MPENRASASMHHEVIIAGFGGQGVLTLGSTLAEAAVLEGREVVWTPAYGAEMRGGPSFCTVIVSSSAIGSPVVASADTAIIMDRLSLPKYQRQVRPNGALLVNSSLVDTAEITAAARWYAIRANHLAEEVGDARTANMVMLGAFLALTRLVRVEAVVEALRHTLPARRHHLIPLNEAALAAGDRALAASAV
ncbi:MAG: 2-oxoglutarate ferredoxin oxidoreductase subunit gamma [bacterium ADurb.Bin429]|nr:MAG: 2-oxoglutarate ferredoxin oxidoreductase subunit gamma [bacterium ADurb.Bin429]